MNLVQSLRRNERWTTLASHVMLILMMICVSYGCVHFGEFVYSGWNSAGLLGLCLFIILEAVLSSRVNVPPANKWIYRVSEWIVIIILVKIFTEIRSGWLYFAHNMLQWSRDFILTFFSPALILNLGLVAFIWIATTLFLLNLRDLERDELILADIGFQADRRAVHLDVLNRYLTLGLVLVIFAGIMRQNPFNLFDHPRATIGDISFLFVYFLLGLVLLSLTNFAVLRSNWISEKAAIRQNLAVPWILYSIIFIAGLTFIATLLPTRYSLSLLDLLAYVLSFLGYVLQLIAGIVIFILVSFINILSLIFNTSNNTPYLPYNTANLNQLLQNPPDKFSPPAWWEFAESFVFWIVLTVILVYAFSQYLRRNKGLADTLARFPLTKWLVDLLKWFGKIFRHTRQHVQSAIRSRMQQFRARRNQRGRIQMGSLIHLHRLNARQRVLFFYHALIRRADETGLRRRPWMTPSEYAQVLEKELAQQGNDIAVMTGAFTEARYTRHELGESLAREVKSVWDRIRTYLRIWQKK
jgi:hypothetical protein